MRGRLHQLGPDAMRVRTMKVSKGLRFPVVALPGVGYMPAAGRDEKEAALVFYVAATRATHKFMITVGGRSHFLTNYSSRIHNSWKAKLNDHNQNHQNFCIEYCNASTTFAKEIR